MPKMKNHGDALPVHLEDDAIISYLDGEMSDEEIIRSQQHLASCWACRSRLKMTQDNIETFMGLRQETLVPHEIPPDGPALDLFRKRLENHKAAACSGSRSIFSYSYWQHKAGNFRFVLKYKAYISGISPLALRATIAVVSVIIIAALVFQIPVKTVSASELLRNAQEAESSKLQGVNAPVLYRKILVHSIRENNHDRTEAITWETWNATTQKHFREAVESESGRQLIAFEGKEGSEPDAPELLADLTQILRLNNMDPENPLGAASFGAWRDSLESKNEEVVKSTSNDGADIFVLHTTPLGNINTGQIAEAELSVRAHDWNPVNLKIKIKEANDIRTFELTEQTTEVVAFNQLSSDIFGTPNPSNASPPVLNEETTEQLPQNEIEPKTPDTETPETTAAHPVATAELEVEVLEMLSRVKADMGEQITAKRESDGILYVSGIVDTPQRKAEIIGALQSVQNNPAVRIEIMTVAEALAKQKQNAAKDSQTATTQGVDIQDRAIASEPELRAFFGRQGGNIDDAIRNYSSNRIAQSRQAMQHLGALIKLANQFSPDELKSLDPTARGKWLGLIRSHARAFQEQSAALRRDLKPVFFAGASENTGDNAAFANDAELVRGIRQLFDLGAANDTVIRSAFAASSGNVRMSAIGSPQFWKALKDAEELSKRIQAAR